MDRLLRQGNELTGWSGRPRLAGPPPPPAGVASYPECSGEQEVSPLALSAAPSRTPTKCEKSTPGNPQETSARARRPDPVVARPAALRCCFPLAEGLSGVPRWKAGPQPLTAASSFADDLQGCTHMARPESKNENAGSMRWLLTYADMITLLMTFFVILYAFSKTDAAKYQEIAASLHAALSGAPLSRGLPNTSDNSLVHLSPTPAPSQQIGPTANDMLIAMAQQIESLLRHQTDTASVHLTAQTLDIRFQGDAVYFASASATLTPTFRRLLRSIAPVLRTTHNEIRVEGFTNDLPLHSRIFPTAWELSAARAVNVLRYLTEVCGLPPHQMEADAFGQWHPRYPNNSPQNLAANRSVDIVVTTDQPPGLDEGGPDIAPPGSGPVP